ncbi:MAG: hypothetical protein ACE5IO_08730, partial [Thermoplasmata archaeon]
CPWRESVFCLSIFDRRAVADTGTKRDFNWQWLVGKCPHSALVLFARIDYADGKRRDVFAFISQGDYLVRFWPGESEIFHSAPLSLLPSSLGLRGLKPWFSLISTDYYFAKR